MLKKEFRLQKNSDIQKVYQEGRYISNSIFTIKYLKNNLTSSRFAFIVSLKISKKATVRNRLKRQLREIVRTNLSFIKPGFDIVISLKNKETFKELKKNLLNLLKKINLLCEK